MTASKANLLDMIEAGRITPEQAVEEFAVTRGKVTYQPPGVQELERLYDQEKKIRESAEANRIPFITEDFYPDFYLSQGLILVGARPGQSKSTTAANVIAGFLASSTKEAIVLTNEDTSETVYNRVACLQLDVSFKAFRNHAVKPETEDMVRTRAKRLMNRLQVVASSKRYDTTVFEDVVGILEHAERSPTTGIVLLDYLQTVSTCRDENLEPFQVSKLLGFFLKEYGRRAPIPVVIFAQLKPESEAKEIEARVQNDKTIYNHAFTFIEICPDFQTGLTKFVIHKERFSTVPQKTEVVMRYVNGRYESEGGL